MSLQKGKVTKVMPIVQAVPVTDIKKTRKSGLTKTKIVRAVAWYVNPAIYVVFSVSYFIILSNV